MAKRVSIFPKGISPKVDAIAQVEFELSIYNVIVQSINHSAMRTALSESQDRKI